MLPRLGGNMDQAAPGAPPVTVAVNCRVWEGPSVGGFGAMLMPVGGFDGDGVDASNEIVAEALFPGSATLVTVTLMVCAAPTKDGAVYTPPLNEPTGGFSDHVTP